MAFLLVMIIAVTPFITHSSEAPPWLRASEGSAPVPITTRVPTNSVAPVTLSSVATPVSPYDNPASTPTFDSAREASLVAGEDLRLRTLLHHISRLTYPVVVPVGSEYDLAAGVTRAGMPTIVLPGPATYTVDDLLANGAVVPLAQGGYILEDNVLVAQGATLKLSSADVPVLLMDSSDSGFTSLVTWGGVLSLAGTGEKTPLRVIGWNKAANSPAVDHGYGRPYIRAVGGELDLKYVDASNLGFWSGRTGGIAWTGINSKASTGSAVSSRFMYNTYGAFVSRSQAVAFTDDLFELNQLDGLRLHRMAVASVVVKSAAVRNAGNGFVVSRGATDNVLSDDVATNNRGNGFLLNGLPLVNGASPSGDNATASNGTMIEHSEAEANFKTGILVEGGIGTIVKNNIVCGPVTGIAVRAGATDTWIIGNDVRCGGRVALSIGPAVSGTTIDANRLANARIGLLIHNSPGVRLFYNTITGVTVFGISVRGSSDGIVGNDNVIAGKGFQPIDVRAGASDPTLLRTDLSGWQHRSSLNAFEALRYHPLLTAWIAVLVLVLVFTIGVRLRRPLAQPYMYGVPWRSASPTPSWAELAEMPAYAVTTAVAAAHPQPALAVASVVADENGHAMSTNGGALRDSKSSAEGPNAAAETVKESTSQSAASPRPEPAEEALLPAEVPEPGASDEHHGQFWKWLAAGGWNSADQEASA